MFQVVFAHPVEPRSVTKECVLIATHPAHTILNKDVTTLKMIEKKQGSIQAEFLQEEHHCLKQRESI